MFFNSTTYLLKKNLQKVLSSNFSSKCLLSQTFIVLQGNTPQGLQMPNVPIDSISNDFTHPIYTFETCGMVEVGL